jgi:anaerobic magnesium-protoporphyrin IX monomethyl ester cyclase
MKIYLLHPPYLSPTGATVKRFFRCTRWQGGVSRGGTYWYPVWLAYTTGVLAQAGHEARLVDAPARCWGLADVIKDVQSFGPGMIVVESNFASLTKDVRLAVQLKEATGAVVVMVGPPASQYPDTILNNGVDIAARFEYDLTIRDIADALEARRDLDTVEGISFKKDDAIVTTPTRDFSTSDQLDEVPFVSKVYQTHLNPRDYFLNHTLHPMVQIFTGRGCPNLCTFCSWPRTLMGRRHRMRSVGNVVDEFEYVAREMPEVREIFIEDDTFTINKQRIVAVCDEIRRRGLRITWSCNARANLDYDTMKTMKDAGCRLLVVGYESGCNQILEAIKKGISTQDSERFTREAKRAGLMILADFIFGLPGETRATAEQTLAFAKKIRPNIVQFAVATPMPGTEFYEWVKENGYLLVDNLEDSIDSQGLQQCIIDYPDFSKSDIEHYVDRALKEYYLSLAYVPVALHNILRKNGLHELEGMVKSAAVLTRYLFR